MGAKEKFLRMNDAKDYVYCSYHSLNKYIRIMEIPVFHGLTDRRTRFIKQSDLDRINKAFVDRSVIQSVTYGLPEELNPDQLYIPTENRIKAMIREGQNAEAIRN
mgnify:FL=1